MKAVLTVVAGLGLAAGLAAPASAFPVAPLARQPAPEILRVAQGCGPWGWRGPWGHCRDTPYHGPLPGGGWAGPRPYPYPYYFAGYGCPPGYWHGPWGHCRDTPYHGRLPGGGWQ
jgi:hypothetical protein